MPRPRRVFISYAHESPEHVEAVRDLWVFLRSCGIDAKLDRIAAQRRQDWPLWMGDQVREADHVLVVASEAYRKRAEGRAGSDEGRGVQWEARLIRDAFYRDQRALDRFVPVVLSGQTVEGVPDFLAPATTTVYEVENSTLVGADSLLRLLLDQPAEVEPPLGEVPTLGRVPVVVASGLRHEVALHVEPADEGRVRTETTLGGTVLGEQVAALPPRSAFWQAELDSPTGGERLTELGRDLWSALVDEPTGRRLEELIVRGPVGSVVDVVVHLAEEVDTLPVELVRLPDGRPAATVAGVRFTRRLAGVDRVASPPLPGPLKILAAVAAPEETATTSPPLDVEAEMQALLDAVTDLDLGTSRAQVRILEVASPAEIERALAEDQYHVLHLSAHGSAESVELEDEDGNPVSVDATALVDALRSGERTLPLVVLSSCRGAASGTAGLAAALVRHGADRVIAMQASVTDGFATDLAREFYRLLADDAGTTVAGALAKARRIVSGRLAEEARRSGEAPRPEFAVPTLLSAGSDLPLRDVGAVEAPLRRPPVVATGGGVRQLPVGWLIGRRGPVRTAVAVLRGNARDREREGAWAGVVVTGIGGIGKTAVAGRILTRAREQGWAVAEHIGAWNPSALITAVAEALADGPVVAALRDPAVADTDKLSLVLSVLERARVVVLFDDFEQNLTPEGEFLDPGFAEIFAALCDRADVGRLLVTCRYPIPGSEAALRRIELPALSAAELGRLFLRLPALRELSIEDRRLVLRTIGGHPRLIEFLDVLLRNGTPAGFRHVTTKLHALAAKEHVNLAPSRDLAAGVSDAVRLGSRDILLDTLFGQLTPGQRELALQASLGRAPFAVVDLAHTRHGEDPASEQLEVVGRDVERLRDLTLLSAAQGGELVVHPWVSVSLGRHHSEEELLVRHQKGAAMRLWRIDAGRGGFEDVVDLINHSAGCHDFDSAVAVAIQVCDLVGGEVAVSALLADTVPLIPTDHLRYLVLADRECQALQAIGLTAAAASRYRNILSIAEQRASREPESRTYQRDLGTGHSRLGDLAAEMGETDVAHLHFQESLAIAERLVAGDPGNAEYQRGLARAHNSLGSLAEGAGDIDAAQGHCLTSLAIRERLVAEDPDNIEYRQSLSVGHAMLGSLAAAMNNFDAAREYFQTSLAIDERLVADDPGNVEYQRGLSVIYNRLGGLAKAEGDIDGAIRHFRQDLAISKMIAASDPGNVQYQRDLSISQQELVVLLELQQSDTGQ